MEDKYGIEVKNITKIYKGPVTVQALDNTNLKVKPKEIVVIIGPSGCGKTSLLKIVGDIIAPTSGQVKIFGRSNSEARIEGRISYFSQEDSLLPWKNAIDNVMLPAIISRKSKNVEISKLFNKAKELLEMTKLKGFEGAYPNQLSGGMKQRLSLARGLMFDPDVFLMDEPFASLDELTRFDTNLELLNLWEGKRRPILFVTHHIPEAVLLADRVFVMTHRPGKLKEEFNINLPRPRKIEMMYKEKFLKNAVKIKDTLIGE